MINVSPRLLEYPVQAAEKIPVFNILVYINVDFVCY
jgi:hypothetical protein